MENKKYTLSVADLIKKLKKVDQNRVVILQKDSEGNGYSPLHDFWTGAYDETADWDNCVGLEKLTDEDRKDGYEESDIVDGVPAIILTPLI